jgi:thymidylate kinase
MIFFIEGTDCAGKSTVIDLLLEGFKQADSRIKFVTHHFEKPKGKNNEQRYGYQQGQFQMMFDWICKPEFKDFHWIFDRSHIGEYVYGPLWRDKEPEYLPDLEDEFLKNYHGDALAVYIKCDPNIVQERFKKHRLDETCPPKKEIEDNQKRFEAAMAKSKMNCVIIDSSKSSPRQVCAQIIKSAQELFKTEL